MRLQSLAQRICGDDRPKQYVPVLGDRTLLRQTLDRVALGIPSVRTAVVTLRSHARYFAKNWVAWSDLGSPRRVFEVLERAQDRPAWLLASDLVAS